MSALKVLTEYVIYSNHVNFEKKNDNESFMDQRTYIYMYRTFYSNKSILTLLIFAVISLISWPTGTCASSVKVKTTTSQLLTSNPKIVTYESTSKQLYGIQYNEKIFNVILPWCRSLQHVYYTARSKYDLQKIGSQGLPKCLIQKQ